MEAIRQLLESRIPSGWFVGPPDVTVDREEILVVGELPDVEVAPDTPDGGRAAGRDARVAQFREETREERIRIAREAEHRFGRKVSWGATCGPVQVLFTSLSVPVMTRLRLNERAVLDVLVDASIARSRSEALAWCVRLVGQHEADWLTELQEALRHVEKVRRAGPKSSQPPQPGGA